MKIIGFRISRSDILKASQMTTQNLSFAAANCFRQMVRESIEQQFDAFKARKFNLETEWKSNYPTVREKDRVKLIIILRVTTSAFEKSTLITV